MNYLIFDVKTIPDLDYGRRFLNLDGLDNEDIGRAMFFQQQQKTGKELLPLYLQKVISISVLTDAEDALEIKSLAGTVKKLNCDELTRLLNKSKATLIDLRPISEYSAGHIISAVHRNIDDIDKQKFKKDDPLIAYSSNDKVAIQVGDTLTKLGFEVVFYLEGGIQAWTENNMPITGEK